jgi:hypothetical protein
MSICRPDSSGVNWFQCANGTVGCPHIHNGRTPHCIACTNDDPCKYHIAPVLEMDEQDYYATVDRGRS